MISDQNQDSEPSVSEIGREEEKKREREEEKENAIHLRPQQYY